MKENKYDDSVFFEKYSRMDRSQKGLEGAGEWETLKKMLPDFQGKRVLDLGCGYGWHCLYAADHGAAEIVGVDISAKMLTVAQEKRQGRPIRYIHSALEDIDFPPASFDVVISSLCFHYLSSFADIVRMVYGCLETGGAFVFTVEHPVFTAQGSQEWYYDEQGNIMHFPVDGYFYEGERQAHFLGERVTKYHRTLTTYVQTLVHNGFEIVDLEEPQPPRHLLERVEGMKDELRRPMMLILSSRKQ